MITSIIPVDNVKALFLSENGISCEPRNVIAWGLHECGDVVGLILDKTGRAELISVTECERFIHYYDPTSYWDQKLIAKAKEHFEVSKNEDVDG